MATSVAQIGAFVKFHQFEKLEDGDNNAPTIWGVATWERPDSDNEVMDYETGKPVYQAWSAKAFKRTKGAGQEPSLGNIRLQHGSEVGGKATKLEFNDDAKEIWLGSEPINDEIHQALKKGFYTGYSQGGSYAWRACDKCDTPMSMQQGDNFCTKCNKFVTVRYGLKRLAEVSYVDSPAIGEGFEHVKSNGSTEIVKFAKKSAKGDDNVAKDGAKTKRVAGEDLPASHFAFVGDPDKTETWKLPIKFSTDEKSKRHVRNALARFEQTQGIPEDKKEEVKAKIHAAATALGIEVADIKAKSDKMRNMFKAKIDARAESAGLEKGLYSVGRLADVIETLSNLYQMSVYERDMEGDESEVPEELQEHLEGLIETFIVMATEEARELSAGSKKTEQGENAMSQETLDAINKAAKKSLAHHFAKTATHHERLADNHEALAEEHENLSNFHDQMCGHHEKCAKALHKLDTNRSGEAEDRGSEGEADAPTIEFHEAAGEIHKSSAKAHKMAAAKHTKMAKAHDAHCEHCTKMAESQDEEEAKKVAKSESEAYAVEKAAIKTEPAKVEKTVSESEAEFGRKAMAKAEEDLLRDPEFLAEVKSKRREALLGKLAHDGAEALAKEALVPTNVRVTAVNRAGDATKFEFAGMNNAATNEPF